MTVIRPLIPLLVLTAFLHAQEPEGAAKGRRVETKGALNASEFAPAGMTGSSVGITLDDNGSVYVSHTNRRNNGELDIRKHKDWLPDSLALTSPEDRQALIKKRMPDSWEGLSRFSEQIVRLDDTDGDGRADKRTVVFEGLNELGSGLAGGVLWHEGALYVTCMPSLWRLTDKDGDGLFETRQELVRGIGFHIGYGGHDMHGPTVGPDGRIYWTSGDKGIHVKPGDGPEVFLPGQGGCFRIEPDGSHFEVFAHGLRNSQELAFDERGNLFTVDNDGDFGDSERVILIVEGADYAWRMHYQYRSDRSWGAMQGHNPWLFGNLWRPRTRGVYQPAYLTPALANFSVGPIGFEFNPGTAMSEEWRNVFFLAESSKAIQALRFEPDGAGFKMLQPQKVLSGPFITGLFFGPDGALYGADWGENAWAPHQKGRVLKLDVADAARDPQRTLVRALIRDGMGRRGAGELAGLLGHADQRVRLKAQFELARRGEAETLGGVAEKGKVLLARIHAVWGLGQMARKDAGVSVRLRPLLGDADPEIRAQAARMLGDANDKAAAAGVSTLLLDSSPRAREYAAIALRKLGTNAQFDASVAMVEQNNDEDVFLRHAGAMALAGCANGKLATLATHSSKAVRLAAVVAARMLADAGAAAFLNDADIAVMSEAAHAIHDDLSIPPAMPMLAQLLDRPGLTDEATLRRSISANIRTGGVAEATRLMNYAARKDAPKAMRAEALDTLGLWATGLAFDRVQGMHRGLPARDVDTARSLFAKACDALIDDRSPEVRTATVRLVRALDDRKAIDRLTPMAMDATLDPAARATALQTLAAARAPRTGEAIALAITSEAVTLRVAALRALAGIAPDAATTFAAIDAALKRNVLTEQQAMFALLASMKNSKAEALIGAWLEESAKGAVPAELMLDVYEAASGVKSLKKKLGAVDAKLTTDNVKFGVWGLALHGGDADEGRAIFSGSTTAACMQCHAMTAGVPGVGPDLSKVAARLTPEHLLQAVIDPQGEIAPGYGLVSVTLKNGSIVSGLLASETADEVVLRIPATLVTNSVKIAEIASRTKPASAMPLMTSLLTKMEVRDLVAYLRTLK